MKKKILSILKRLESENISDFLYSLTINYQNIVHNFNFEKFNLIDIENIINSHDKIETYNLTLFNYGRYDENRYKSYYHNVDLIFHSGGIVFNFTSPYLSNRELNTNIDNLFKIYEEHIVCSKSLYNVINKIK